MKRFAVLTWDASFRESVHTMHAFDRQDFDKDAYEFVWADAYQGSGLARGAAEELDRVRLLTLQAEPSEPWHLGRCINAAAAQTDSEILVIPDGDVMVDPSLLKTIDTAFRELGRGVLYFHRFDEPQRAHGPDSRSSLEHLREQCVLNNPGNHAACVCIDRASFEAVGGYETHDAFAGPGMQAIELFTRLRNLGLPVQWVNEPMVFHPWHPSTGSGSHDAMQRKLARAGLRYRWLLPYAGPAQSWVVHRRQQRLSTRADEAEVNTLLAEMPDVLEPRWRKALRKLTEGNP